MVVDNDVRGAYTDVVATTRHGSHDNYIEKVHMPLSRTEREQRIWDAAEYIANEVEKFMQQDPVLNTVETLGMDLMEIAGVTDGKDVHAFCHMIEQRIYAAVAHKLTEPVDLDDLQLDFPTG